MDLEEREQYLKYHIENIFRERFGAEPTLVKAPGRINLLGEHLDYNAGVVLPTAIDKHIFFAIAPSNSQQCTIVALDYDESISFQIDDLKPNMGWVSYFMGVLQGAKNVECRLSGFNCVFGGDIPDGAGLSSSAALCCGFGFALNEIFELNLKRLDLALIAQYAEHEFAGVNCGLMDQYACLFSQENRLLQLDCRSLTHELVPFSVGNLEILLIDTKVKHELASSAYNDRRASCEEGVRHLKTLFPEIDSLRDAGIVQLTEIQKMTTADVYTCCLYVLEEMERVLQGVTCLQTDDMVGFGQLMYKSHQGLSKQYKVSCSELDYLVALANENEAVGSRMMGGGFGGCTINLIHCDNRVAFEGVVSEKYHHRFNVSPSFYKVSPSKGVSLIS